MSTQPQDDLNLLKLVAQKDLVHLLERLSGVKDLIIEECFMKLLDKIIGVTALRNHEVNKIFKLEPGVSKQCGEMQQIFIIQAKISSAQTVIECINATRSELANNSNRKRLLILVPRKTHAIERLLEEHGVYGKLQIECFNPGLIQIDSDLLSLEMPQFFPSFFINGSAEHIYTIAHSLWNLQNLFGPIAHVYCVGAASAVVTNLLEKLTWELGEPRGVSTCHFSHLFIVDRDFDYASVLLSCLTYEGLLDELYQIKVGTVELPTEITKQERSTKWSLNSQDDLYQSIRNRHFSTVFPFLRNRARQLQEQAEKVGRMQNVNEMKQFVGTDLRVIKTQQRSLAIHIGICEAILNRKKANFEEQLQYEHGVMVGNDVKDIVSYIEDCMTQQLQESIPLSLMCLLSLSQNGLHSKDYISLRSQFLQAYGHKHLILFHCLRKLGVLVEKDANKLALRGMKPNIPGLNLPLKQTVVDRRTSEFVPSTQVTACFASLVKRLNATPRDEAVDLKSARDPSYMFNGAYVPLICQLVSLALQNGFAEVRTDLQRCLPDNYPLKQTSHSSDSVVRNVLVYVLGGVTYAEMVSLRWLSTNKSYNIVIAATNVINRENWLKQMTV